MKKSTQLKIKEMFFKLVFVVFYLVFLNCKAQQIKIFDIESYKKRKLDPSHEGYYLKDSTYIREFDAGGDGIFKNYIELITYPDNFFQEYRIFHHNGRIKVNGLKFFNDFEKGIWKEYDEQGNLLKETDYDKPYKFTWEDVLAFIKKRKIDMNTYGFRVGRNVVDGSPVWSITYNKKDEHKLGVVSLDGITGKIIDEHDKDYPGED